MAIDTSNLVKFKKGSLAGYQGIATKDNNTLYITTDQGGIYLGDKRLGDFHQVANIDALTALTNKADNALYYAVAENVLARWDSGNSKWVQINAAGLVSLATGENTGNVVTSVTVDATGKVTVNKAITAATASELAEVKALIGTTSVDSKLSSLKSELEGSIGAVEDKADAAQSAAEGAQGTADEALGKANTNAGNITTLQGDVSGLKSQMGTGTVDARIEAAKTELQGKIDAVDELADKGIADAATAQAKADEAFTKAGENAGNITTLQNDVAGLKSTDAQLNSRLEAVEGALGADGSVDEKIAALRKEILTDGTADDTINDAYDTIQEIATWLAGSDGENGKTAAEIISELNTHTNDIAGLKGQIGTGTVDSRIAAAKSAILGDATEGTDTLGTVKATAAQGVSDAAAAQSKADEAFAATGVNAGNISTLQGDVGGLKSQVGTGTVDSRIAAAKSAILGDAVEGTDTLGTVKVTAAQGVSDAAAAQSTANEALGKANANAGNIQTNANGVAANAADIKNIVDNVLTWGSF